MAGREREEQGLFGGNLFPVYFFMEGDTPAFLSLIDNGLASYRTQVGVDGEDDMFCDEPRENHAPSGPKEEIVFLGVRTLEIP